MLLWKPWNRNNNKALWVSVSKKSLVQSFDLCLWLDMKKDHTCVTCVNKVVVSCSYTSLTKSWNWLAIRYWGQLLCVYGSLWLVYNVNWTPFIARI